MLLFVEQHRMPAWALLLVVARVCRDRSAADRRGNGACIAAAWSGKIRRLDHGGHLPDAAVEHSWLNTVCWVVIVVTTVYSSVEYFVKSHDVFRKAA